MLLIDTWWERGREGDRCELQQERLWLVRDREELWGSITRGRSSLGIFVTQTTLMAAAGIFLNVPTVCLASPSRTLHPAQHLIREIIPTPAPGFGIVSTFQMRKKRTLGTR